MNNQAINQALITGQIEQLGVLPHLDELNRVRVVFEQNFGLEALPTEPGVIFIRGPRQYGKSTWLEQQIARTIQQFGPGSALYLNGDDLSNDRDLFEAIQSVLRLFRPQSHVKRLFIDEITAVSNWEKAIKRVIDLGLLNTVLLVTTGSKATDLRRGIERLPGRKGKLSRTQYVFTPLSYQTFSKQTRAYFQEDTLFAYLLSGGSPMAANALLEYGRIPEYIIAVVHDWVFGEVSAQGRSRAYLLAILQSVYRMAGNPIGQAKLARESGLANNTVAQGYIDLLSDLMILSPCFAYDLDKNISVYRKPCKYQFINLLTALTWHPNRPRTIMELKNLGPGLGVILEWAVAQEIFRRRCIQHGEGLYENLNFWQSKDHEIDFVLPEQRALIEVKSGSEQATNFMWFLKNFPNRRLTVINKNRFETQGVVGITLEDFLQST